MQYEMGACREMGTRYCIQLKWGVKSKDSNEIAIREQRNMYEPCNK